MLHQGVRPETDSRDNRHPRVLMHSRSRSYLRSSRCARGTGCEFKSMWQIIFGIVIGIIIGLGIEAVCLLCDLSLVALQRPLTAALMMVSAAGS